MHQKQSSASIGVNAQNQSQSQSQMLSERRPPLADISKSLHIFEGAFKVVALTKDQLKEVNKIKNGDLAAA